MNSALFFMTLLSLQGLTAATPAQTKEDVPALIKDLKANFVGHREKAARALEKIGPDARDAVDPLIDALKVATFPTERIAVAQALAAVGPGVKEKIVPALAERLKVADFSGEIQGLVKACETIKADPPQVLPALTAALKNAKFLHDRIAVVKYVGTFGPNARDAVPALIEALKNPFPQEREVTCQALGEIGASARDAVPALTEISEKGPFPSDKQAAAAALKKIKDAQ